MPLNDNSCRQRLIDNATGQIHDNGTVDCEAALAQSSGRRLSGTRVDIIRDGFFKKWHAPGRLFHTAAKSRRPQGDNTGRAHRVGQRRDIG
jgi:hypothetical protein